ncbi:MAG: tetratricopeptide repeat protein [Ignavibacteriaceae bacterium]
MKFKPLYFYGAVFIIVVAILIILSQQSGNVENASNENLNTQQIPNDEIHSQLKSGETPGKNNVSQEFKHKMAMLQNEVEKNPTDTTKLLEYANLLAAAHKQKEAIEYYQQILSINPNRIDVLFSLSFIYYSLGDLNKSEEETKRILAIDPENNDAKYNLGAIAATKGDKEKARDIWQRLAEKYPEDEIGIKAKNSLERLK